MTGKLSCSKCTALSSRTHRRLASCCSPAPAPCSVGVKEPGRPSQASRATDTRSGWISRSVPSPPPAGPQQRGRRSRWADCSVDWTGVDLAGQGNGDQTGGVSAGSSCAAAAPACHVCCAAVPLLMVLRHSHPHAPSDPPAVSSVMRMRSRCSPPHWWQCSMTTAVLCAAGQQGQNEMGVRLRIRAPRGRSVQAAESGSML